jgi:hypothetical protein
MTVSRHKVPVALKLPTRVPDLLVHARAIVAQMTGNSWFPAPVPALQTVQGAIDRLANAETAGLSGTRGLKEPRNAARAALINLLTRLKAYVQGVADENPEHGPSIVESAAMSVATRTLSPKPALSVFRGRTSGSVQLVAKAVAKVAGYEWQRRRGGETWTSLPQTMQAKTTAAGLSPGTTYSFRMRAVTRTGVGDWCEPVEYVMQ